MDFENIENRIRSVFNNGNFGLSDKIKRKIIIYLLKKYTELTIKEIGEEFNVSGSAISIAIKRFNKELDLNFKLSEILNKIEKKLSVNVENRHL